MDKGFPYEGTLDDKSKYISRWALGISLTLAGLGSIMDNGVITAFVWSAGGIALIPPVASKINKHMEGQFGFTAQLAAFLGVLFIGGAFMAEKPEEPITTVEVVETVEVPEIIEPVVEEPTTPELSPEELAEIKTQNAIKDLENKISSKETEISQKEYWITSFDCPFDEYQRINDMYMAAGNFNANKDQYFINVWQGEINELQSELASLNSELNALN